LKEIVCKILNFIKIVENRLLTHWVERPLDAFGSMIFLTTLLFSFSLFLFVCLFVGLFVGKKACPSMALLGVGNS